MDTGRRPVRTEVALIYWSWIPGDRTDVKRYNEHELMRDDSVMTLWLVTSSDYFVHLCTVIVCSNDSDDDLWETQSFDCNITFVSQQKYSAKKNPMRKRFLSTTSVQSGRSDWLGNLCHQAYSSQRNAKGVLKGVMRRQMWPWWPSFCPTLFEIWMWTSQRRITSPEMPTF